MGEESKAKCRMLNIQHCLSNASAALRRCSGYGRFHHLVDQLFQLLARLEVRDLLRWYFDLLAGLGVTASTRFAAAEAEAAEAAKVDLLAGRQRADAGIEDDVVDRVGLLLLQLD